MVNLFVISLSVFVVALITLVKVYHSLRAVFSPPKPKKSQPLRIAFLHPDLGIGISFSALRCLSHSLGGAEKLVVEAAVGLQKKGHKVQIFTSFHDKKHSFPETHDGIFLYLAEDLFSLNS
jgi:hypothetical protein